MTLNTIFYSKFNILSDYFSEKLNSRKDFEIKYSIKHRLNTSNQTSRIESSRNSKMQSNNIIKPREKDKKMYTTSINWAFD